MQIKIIDSGSQGNCAIIKDTQNNQLIIDCGVKYEKIAIELDWDNPCNCLISHYHSDHFNEQAITKLKRFGVNVYSQEEMTNGKPFQIEGFNVLPVACPHGNDCVSFTFLIFNRVEKKSIFFATDCTSLPNLADKHLDLFMVENNYDEETVFEKRINHTLKNLGYERHLSTEYVIDWLKKRKNKPKQLIISHLSNSGNIAVPQIQERYIGQTEKLYIAKPKLIVDF